MYTDTIRKNLQRVEKLVDEKTVLAAGGFPMFSWVEISPIDMCNRDCVFCPRHDETIAPNQNLTMPAQLYRKMANELAGLNYGGTVMLAGYGEPLLAKEAVDMVSTFSQVCNTEVTTNGDPLRPQLIERLMTAGIGKIIVSLYDGPAQIEKFERMFADAGAPPDLYILRDRWYGIDDDFGVKLTNRSGMVNVGKQAAVDPTKKCFYPHYFMMIDWNGDVFLCTQDWNRRVKSGNLMMSTFEEVWTSSLLRRYRTHLAAGRRDLPPCAQCNAEGTLHGWNHASAWTDFYRGSVKAKAASGGQIEPRAYRAAGHQE